MSELIKIDQAGERPPAPVASSAVQPHEKQAQFSDVEVEMEGLRICHPDSPSPVVAFAVGAEAGMMTPEMLPQFSHLSDEGHDDTHQAPICTLQPPQPPALTPEIRLAGSRWGWPEEVDDDQDKDEETTPPLLPPTTTAQPPPPPGFLRLRREWRQRPSALRRSQGGTAPAATRHGISVMATYNGQSLTEEPFRNVWEVSSCTDREQQSLPGHHHHPCHQQLQQRVAMTNGDGGQHKRFDDDIQSSPSSTGATINCSL